MRLQKQNRFGCIVFALLLALVAALVLWGAVGGVDTRTTADDAPRVKPGSGG